MHTCIYIYIHTYIHTYIHIQKLCLFFEDQGHHECIKGSGQIHDECCTITGKLDMHDNDKSSVYMECTSKTREQVHTLRGKVAVRKGKACEIHGTYASKSCTDNRGELTLYAVETESVGADWFGRYDYASVAFRGKILEFRGNNWALAQAKRPVSIDNNYFEVKVCMYVCMYACMYVCMYVG
jgi:hypothetical protein